MNDPRSFYRTRINRLVSREFGHDGKMPLEEFAWHCSRITCDFPDLPNPPVQVAKSAEFRWNPETRWSFILEVWGETHARLAEKHLSREARARLRGKDASDLTGLIATYQAARRARKGNSEGRGCLGVDAALRSLRATRAAPEGSLPVLPNPRGPSFTNTHGDKVGSGLCCTCSDRSRCFAAREGKRICNDHSQAGNARQGTLNARSRAGRGQTYADIGGSVARGPI